jgi:hypothetical protein
MGNDLSVLRRCALDGCDTLTFGPLCLEHEPPVAARRFPRGRPYRIEEREVTGGFRRIEEAWPDQAWPLVEQVSLRLPSRS